MSMVSRGIKAGLATIRNHNPSSAPVPPAASHQLPSQANMASGFLPTEPVNTKPAGECELTLDATLNNLKEIASGVIPTDKP